MSASSIGGFFVDLGLVTDEKSFMKGMKSLDAVSMATKAILGVVLKTSAAMFGMATAAGVLANAEEKSARSIGISVTELEKWKAVADIAGVKNAALIQNMAQLEEKAQRMKFGEVDEKLGAALSWLGINHLDFADMSAEERMKAVFHAAEKSDDQAAIAFKVKDILGEAGVDLYRKIQASGSTLEEYLERASKSLFTDNESAKMASAYAEEMNQLKIELKSLSNLLGSEIADGLVPVLKELNNFLQENVSPIKDFIHNVTHPWETFDVAGGAVNAITGVGGDVVTSTGTEINKNPAYIKYLEEEIKKSDEKLKEPGWHPFEKLNNERLKSELEFTKKTQGIQDGIIAPGGRVTQVAPDDWVFAARDLGKLAGAFMPRQAAQAGANVTINQTITVNGGRDVPAVVKEAARNGTTRAIEEMSTRTANIIQFMPAR